MPVGCKKLQPDGTSVFIAAKDSILAATPRSQPTIEKDEMAERSLDKQTNDDFVEQYFKMQKHFVKAVDSLRITFSVTGWEKDFGVDTVEGVLRADWNKPLRASGDEDLDLFRSSLLSEIRQAKNKLRELCKEQRRKRESTEK
jgi:hypothetical protein